MTSCFNLTRVKRFVGDFFRSQLTQAKEKIAILRTIKPFILDGSAGSKLKLVNAGALTIAKSSFNVLMPMVLGKTVESLNSENSVAEIMGYELTPAALLASYVAFWVLSQASTKVRSLVTEDIIWDAQRSLSDALVKKVGDLSYAYRADPENHSMTAKDEIERSKWAMYSLVQAGVIQIAPSIFEVLAALWMLKNYFGLEYLPALGLIGLTYATYTNRLFSSINKRHTEVERSFQTVRNQLSDSLQNLETADYHNNIDHERKYISGLLIDQKNKIMATARAYNAVEAGQSFIISVGVGYVLFNHISDIMNGKFSPSNFIFLHSLLLQLSQPIDTIGGSMTQVMRAINELSRAAKLLNETPLILEDCDAVALSCHINSIEFRNVSFSYPGKPRKALDNVSFKILQGEKVGFVGETGSGKSTVFKLLMRFYDVDSGEILINGMNIKRYTLKSLRKSIAAVPQETGIFNRTLKENIQYGRLDASEEELNKVIEQSQLSRFFMTHSLDEKVGEKGITLSGGEKQRIGIARALLKNPGMYLLDEITAALDSATENEIMDNFSKVTSGKMVIIIAHRLSTVQACNKIIVLEGGKIIQEGAHEKLLREEGKYAFLWRQQQAKNTEAPADTSSRNTSLANSRYAFHSNHARGRVKHHDIQRDSDVSRHRAHSI